MPSSVKQGTIDICRPREGDDLKSLRPEPSMKSMPLAAIVAVQLALAPTAQAELSKAESGMAKTVAAEQDRSLTLLEKLVNQNSGSLNLEGVEKVGAMMRAELEPLGFKVEWKPMTDTGRAGQ